MDDINITEPEFLQSTSGSRALTITINMKNYHLDPETIGALTKSPRHAGYSFGTYKWVDKKIKPVAQAIPPEFKVTRTMPYDPLLTLEPPDIHFKNVTPTDKFT